VAALVWRLPKSLSWSSLPCTALWGWHNYLLPAFTGDRFALLLPPSLILSPFPLILVFLHAHQKTNRIFTLSCLLSREPKLSTVQLENLLKYKSTLLSGVNWTRIWGKNFRIFWFFFWVGFVLRASHLQSSHSTAWTLEPHLQSILLWLFWKWCLINPGCPWTMILSISAFQVAKITGVIYSGQPESIFN
jgi:hypothetical protein